MSGSSSGSMGEAHPLMAGAEKVTAKDNHRMSDWIQVTLHCMNMTRVTAGTARTDAYGRKSQGFNL